MKRSRYSHYETNAGTHNEVDVKMGKSSLIPLTLLL
jgi:hypothetical protein